MKNPSQLSKLSFRLPDFDHRLSAYALAATAAGVGVLALALPVEGEIVYTKANKHIVANTTAHLDLNHDGIPDFDLKDVYRTSFYSAWGSLFAVPDRGKNAVWGHTDHFSAYASALLANVRVGPKGQFLPGAGVMAASSFLGGRARYAIAYGNGPWANVMNRYLGLKFVIKGKTHFGWARLNVSIDPNTVEVSATLTGYAYETVANRPILTGRKHGTDESDIPTSSEASSATLGRLARGAGSRRPGN